MKKGQKIFQKYVVTFAIILAAISILYALSFATPFAPFMDVKAAYEQQVDWEIIANANPSKTYADVVREQQPEKADKIISAYKLTEKDYYLFNEIQPFNQKLFTLTVIFLVLSLALLVFKTGSRRIYYISNYISSFIYAASGIALSIYAFINIINFFKEFKAINFNEVSNTVNLLKQVEVSGDATMLYFGFVIFALIIVFSLLLLVNALLKYLANKKDANDFKEIDAEIRAKQAEKERELLSESQLQNDNNNKSELTRGEVQ